MSQREGLLLAGPQPPASGGCRLKKSWLPSIFQNPVTMSPRNGASLAILGLAFLLRVSVDPGGLGHKAWDDSLPPLWVLTWSQLSYGELVYRENGTLVQDGGRQPFCYKCTLTHLAHFSGCLPAPAPATLPGSGGQGRPSAPACRVPSNFS